MKLEALSLKGGTHSQYEASFRSLQSSTWTVHRLKRKKGLHKAYIMSNAR